MILAQGVRRWWLLTCVLAGLIACAGPSPDAAATSEPVEVAVPGPTAATERAATAVIVGSPDAPAPPAPTTPTAEPPAEATLVSRDNDNAATAAPAAGAANAKPADQAPAQTAAVTPATTPAATPATTPAAAEPVAAGRACGEDGEPKCPLEAWMEQQVDLPLEHEDWKQLEQSFARLRGFAPDPSWNAGAQGWAALSDQAAAAAKSADATALRATCKSCHRAFRAKYKESFRPRPLP